MTQIVNLEYKFNPKLKDDVINSNQIVYWKQLKNCQDINELNQVLLEIDSYKPPGESMTKEINFI